MPLSKAVLQQELSWKFASIDSIGSKNGDRWIDRAVRTSRPMEGAASGQQSASNVEFDNTGGSFKIISLASMTSTKDYIFTN